MTVIKAGNFDLAFFIDQICRNVVFLFIFLQQAFDIIDIHADAHYTNHPAGRIPDPAVYKQSDLIGRTSNFIIIDIKAVFFAALQKIIIPDVFILAPDKIAVQTVEIIIIIGGRRNQEHRIIGIFIFIGIQILPNRFLITGLLITAALFLQQLDQQAVMRHRLRDIHRLGQHRRQTVINTFRGQRGDLFDLHQ